MEKIIVGNFKMNLTKEEILSYIKEMKKSKYHKKAIYCPSSIYIPYFIEANLKVGVQNISSFEVGAHTGEISAKQIKSVGASYVIIGHSERREKETEEEIQKKIEKAIKENLKVIFCIGEKEEEIEKREEILKKQIENSIENMPKENIIIAYEPVWSIGTGLTMKKEEIRKVSLYIKSVVKEKCKVLYGGSVNEKNIEDLSKIEEIDGFLVGGASLNPEVFLKMIEVAVTM